MHRTNRGSRRRSRAHLQAVSAAPWLSRPVVHRRQPGISVHAAGGFAGPSVPLQRLPPAAHARSRLAVLAGGGTNLKMLRGIHPLLTPDLLFILASMGHGDRII